MKKLVKTALLSGSVAITLLAGSSATMAAEQTYVSIGTGGVTGVYYPAGGAICRLVNKKRKETGLRCSVESTGGSVFNINAIRKGDLEMGVAQSDWQFHAYNGSSKFKSAGPFKDLRAVFSLHAEPATLVVRADSGIKEFKDIKGKRVNIGQPGSGTVATFDVIAKAYGIKRSDLKLAAELKSSEMGKALCDNKIDAYFILVGHPAGLIKETTTTCGAKIADIHSPVIDNLVKSKTYFRYASIPANMYRGTPTAVKTFGVGATFVSSAKVPEKVIYEVVKSVFDNIDSFKKLHPALKNLKVTEMVKDGLSAPLHSGAIKYFKEKKLLK
ncbi:MAG: TAXI family TRAP transporter solute-binding subunit [Cocleimonas sp.]|nr:TAXI family TRAP transporter solute-binding subunit [Cocleimonas sp.]